MADPARAGNGRHQPSRDRAGAPLLPALLEALVARPGFPILIVAFVALECAVQLITPALRRDQAISALWAQTLALAYTPNNPPLFTWATYLLSQVLGPGELPQLLLRGAALAATFLALHRLAALLLRDERLVALGAAAPILTYVIGFDAALNYTDTVLALPFVPLTVIGMIALARRPGLLAAALLGVAIGLGVLAKYTFLLFVVPLLLAAGFDPLLRAALLSRWGGAALALAVALVAPHLAALLADHAAVAAHLAGTLQVGGEASRATGLLKGSRDLLLGFVNCSMPMALVFLACFPRAFRPGAATPAAAPPPARAWLARTLAMGAVLLVVLVLGGAGRLRWHWLLPLLVLLPLLLMLRVEAAGFGAAGLRGFAASVAAAAVLAVVAVLALETIGDRACKRCQAYIDYGALAKALRGLGFERGTILAGDHIVGANLLAHLPEARVIAPKYPTLIPPLRDAADGRCLLLSGEWAEFAWWQVVLFAWSELGLDRHIAAEREGSLQVPFATPARRTWRIDYMLMPPMTAGCGAAGQATG